MIEASSSKNVASSLTYGMVGGGPGSFIGPVHRASIAMTGVARLSSGCFSRSADLNSEAGEALGIENGRIYGSFDAMAEGEAARPDPIDFAVITTPNYAHYAAAKALLSRGISVMCEKPLCMRSSEAKELGQLAGANDCVLGVSYTYSGHVMAKQARELVKNGEIGEILTVVGEYPQEWLVDKQEDGGQRQALWRTSPAAAGISNCIGDIGTHIEHTVAYITGLEISRLAANLETIGEGRNLDTNSSVLVKYSNGASGNYWCSQVAIGCDNGLRVRIFGTKGSLDFVQEESNYLIFTKKGQPPMRLSRGNGYVSPGAAEFSRLPSGHPEGYHDAFRNIYEQFIAAVIDSKSGGAADLSIYDFPGGRDGYNGVKFIEKCVESSRLGGVWVDF